MVSKVFICNYYSTTISTANLLSVPTIEYTDYHREALKLTNQGSLYPEYVDFFIKRDKKLEKVLLSCLKKDEKEFLTYSPDKKLLNKIVQP